MKAIRRDTLTILAVSIIASALLSTMMAGAAYTPQKVTEIISRPLPSLPEPVLVGGELPIQVNADESATGWTAELTNKYDSASLGSGMGVYSDFWDVTFDVPGDLLPGLYDLTVTWSGGEATQSNCVWVMEDWPESLTISQSSDIHQPYGKDVYAQYIHEMNLIQPDLLLTTGDIVDVETIAAAWGFLQGTMLRSEVPIYLMPGNHDHTSGSALYQQYCGKNNYTVVIGDFIIVALDSHSGGFVDLEDIQWADSVFKMYPDKVKIVGFHHPLLSSEYEDDQGTVTGGEITGSWENIDDLTELMYFTWLDNMEEAAEILKLIQENDVRLVLSGHVHRDMIYILNDQHYFISTTPAGGGLPPGSIYGYRLLKIDNDGTVTLDKYATTGLYTPPNSVPLNEVQYYYKGANDGSGTSVSASVINGLEMPITDARLEFTVSSSSAIDDYIWYPEAPKAVETYSTSEGHVFVAYFDLPASSTLDITISDTTDDASPTASVEMPSSLDAGEALDVTIEASDVGWGVKDVDAWYSTDSGSTWTSFELSFAPIITGDEYIISYNSESYAVTVPTEGASEVEIKVETTDYAGNTVTEIETVTLIQPPAEFTLALDTIPSGIQVMVNGNTEDTPYSETLQEGAYTVEAPPSTTIDETEYAFKEWSDGETSISRTIDLDTNTELTVKYEEKPITEQETEPEPDSWEGIPIPPIFIAIGILVSVYSLRKKIL
ncbi:MAG: metallophosphoesterase [Candidatus Bathyarchaeota archaeon]|nr:metallophosphoesterase [Candidatus Bathyarchaeota archaeon]